MKFKERIRLYLLGGKVTFPIDPDDPNLVETPALELQENGLSRALIALVIWLLLPLLSLPSPRGSIPYIYPEYFAALSIGDQYITLLALSLAIALKAVFSLDVGFLPESPTSVSPVTGIVLGLIIIVAYIVIVGFIASAARRIRTNVKKISSSSAIKQGIMREVTYGRLLSNLWNGRQE